MLASYWSNVLPLFHQIRTTPDMNAIINRTQKFGTLNGVITKNEEIMRVVFQHLKQGTAKLLVDSEETLMYKLGAA